ncbi:fibronectin type III domain-containing protein 10 [Triplophysa dalaica]|uniref:fibronectin type III domain-containing protein 10 n=1 Tax=Triplophysa dalaica TaxID=1582913 RepID=UPI0024DFA30C|nr:fibronectin type III domain-containing protein 10 [Triplophysa dalaica]
MSRRQGSDLVRCCALLMCVSTASLALPNRTVRSSPYETADGDNMNRSINTDTPELNKSNIELIPKLQDDSSTARARPSLGSEIGPLCAYRILSAGDPGRLCFRYTLSDFRCPVSSCRQVRSPDGQLTANVLSNSSVFIQWTVPGHAPQDSSAPPKSPGQTGGFRLSCWWNGSYAQFECAGVHLGSSCRDYLLDELHADAPYRLCVRPYAAERPAACVEFNLAPNGMQDIVIAMTTVGGAICVMLVIICLLVAYITENIMNPQHTLSAQHSHRSHLHTHL